MLPSSRLQQPPLKPASRIARSGTLLLLGSSLLALLSACSSDPVQPHSSTTNTPSAITATATGKQAIASAHPLATRAGMDILNAGGNAFDAAVAVAASLGVVEPYSAGIGGGGFWLLYLADKDEYRFVDAREQAPAAAGKDYYLDDNGDVNRDRAINGPTAAGIPGQAAAFAWLAEHYGTLPLIQSLAPAIQQAQSGFPVYEHYRRLMKWRLDAIKRYTESARLFLDNGQIPELDYLIKQPELAQTLERLGKLGHDGFYRGKTAQALVEGAQQAGGDWTLQDLQDYKVVERDPIRVSAGHGQFELISAPPPSSGGVALAQMLSMLDQFDWQAMNTVQQTHLLAEVMRRAYHDRAQYLGDPDYVDVPVDKLISNDHNLQWASSIDLNKATPSITLQGPKNFEEGFHTTHLSVLDANGNMVSATLSINLPFGSAFTVPGTGVLLNNEMDDFSAKPGEPNAYGLVGAEANAIAPGKRPLSSMSPSFLISDDQTAILGTPGGSRIITMVLLGSLEAMQHKPVEDWVSRPRIHHQYLPDLIQYEPGALSDDEMAGLRALGHSLKDVGRNYGNMQAIKIDRENGEVTAASDPRGLGEALVKDQTAE